MKKNTDLDRVWRAVVSHHSEGGLEHLEYFGPFSSSRPAAAAVTRAKRRPWFRDEKVTGRVESSVVQWEPRDE